MSDEFSEVNESIYDDVPMVDDSSDYVGDDVEMVMQDDGVTASTQDTPQDIAGEDIPVENVGSNDTPADDTSGRTLTVNGMVEGETTPETTPETREWRPRYY